MDLGYYLQSLAVFALTVALPQTVTWLYVLSPVWLVIVFLPFAWHKWTTYTRFKWIAGEKKALLEIKIPQETIKSPAAMELVLNALHQTGGEGTPVDRYWDGKARPWASLEVAAINGEIRFFIWCFEKQKATIMSALYASFPDLGVHDADDYTRAVAENIDKYDIYSCEFKFTKPDPYPIKTYVDYGLSDDPDEELKVDPMASFIEALGSIKNENQVWFQFITRAHTAEKTIFNGKHPDKWIDQAKEEIEKISKETIEEKDGKKTKHMERLSEGQKEQVKAIERSISKFGFDVGIRAVNVVPKGKGGFDMAVVKGSFKQFGSNNLNGLAPEGTEFDYPWQDKKGKIVGHWRSVLFKMYCERSYFHPPYTITDIPHHKPMVFNTEELATIYHFPGSVVKTPALKRIPSKRADAPANLPI